MIIKIFEFVRIAGVTAAFYFGYSIGLSDGYNPVAQLHIMIPIVIFCIAGLSGIEGVFFGRQAAAAKGYEQGSNYQLQSAIALLSYTVISIVVYILEWGIKAELTVFFTFMFFLILSASNHLYQAVANKNYKFANINRPFLTLVLIAGMIYPVIQALKTF
nr:hypothetical protein [Bacteroidota bacterium]